MHIVQVDLGKAQEEERGELAALTRWKIDEQRDDC